MICAWEPLRADQTAVSTSSFQHLLFFYLQNKQKCLKKDQCRQLATVGAEVSATSQNERVWDQFKVLLRLSVSQLFYFCESKRGAVSLFWASEVKREAVSLPGRLPGWKH